MRYDDELWRTGPAEQEEETVGLDGRLQVFCLAHAGGNTVHFHAWSQWLPGRIQAIPIDLPGHGTRLREPLVGEWQLLVDDLTRAVHQKVDGPFVLFGHSLGALLAYEVCRALEGRGRPPALLVTAGRNGPSAGLSHRPIHALPDAHFLAALRRLGGTPEGVLHQPELLQMFLPVLRSDLRLAELYAREPGPPLACPVLAFSGRRDRMTDDTGMLAWKRETTGTCEIAFVEGGHFFLEEREFTEALAARLTRLRVRADQRAGRVAVTVRP